MTRSTLTNPARRLPHVGLQPAVGKREVPIIWRRTGPMLLFLHARECAACRDYAAQVAGAIDEIQEWDGRPLIIQPDEAEPAGLPVPESIPVLRDTGNRLAERLGVVTPAVLIADQWGEIYESHAAGDAHDFLAPEELVSWARTIATKCPECEGEAF